MTISTTITKTRLHSHGMTLRIRVISRKGCLYPERVVDDGKAGMVLVDVLGDHLLAGLRRHGAVGTGPAYDRPVPDDVVVQGRPVVRLVGAVRAFLHMRPVAVVRQPGNELMRRGRRGSPCERRRHVARRRRRHLIRWRWRAHRTLHGGAGWRPVDDGRRAQPRPQIEHAERLLDGGVVIFVVGDVDDGR
ncbi:hypothetical protein NP493_420g01013 [Ridgeia piscesae]|uniref:Uncharacterized protein n=1 Tax=Ridgeia piscesae TaxID=27915 RepID=A0AAD9L058_RIDPI|nr:hypothetical protein NP493_420g01013 [Ridgeia piscesae]